MEYQYKITENITTVFEKIGTQQKKHFEHEMTSGLDQIQNFCVARQWEMPVQNKKTYYPVKLNTPICISIALAISGYLLCQVSQIHLTCVSWQILLLLVITFLAVTITGIRWPSTQDTESLGHC